LAICGLGIRAQREKTKTQFCSGLLISRKSLFSLLADITNAILAFVLSAGLRATSF
jgi:hypothetical protein